MKKIITKTKTWVSNHKEQLIRVGFYGAGLVVGVAIEQSANQRGRQRAWDTVESETPEGLIPVIDRDGTLYNMKLEQED